MTLTITFIAALPLSVWLLALACAVIDEPQRLRPLIRLAAAISALIALMLLTDRALIYPVLLAFALVTLLHIAGHALMLHKGTGVLSYRPSPQTPPLLEAEAKQEINSDF